MKKILFIFSVLWGLSFYAQPPNGNRRSSEQNEQTEKPVKFSASNVAGVFYYDIDRVIKKIKVKEDVLKDKVSKVLRNYNNQIKNISFLNSKKISDLDLIANSTSLGNEREEKKGVREKVKF